MPVNTSVEYLPGADQTAENPLDQLALDEKQSETHRKISSFIINAQNKARNARIQKQNIWNECWELYRGKQDFSNKESWHSKIVLPKTFNSVKRATSTIQRFLSTSRNPWTIDSVNPDDLVTAYRGGQITQVLRVLLENAKYRQHFGEGLESGFIIGLGIWKVWWSIDPRTRHVTKTSPRSDGRVNKQIVKQTIDEGNLHIASVDPYKFWWLPGSKLNKFKGTIEEISIPKYELKQMKKRGAFNAITLEEIDKLGGSRGQETTQQTNLRFDEVSTKSQTAGDSETEEVTLYVYYGPLIVEKEVIEERAHVIVEKGGQVLHIAQNKSWRESPPYIAFSPLMLPFRTEGVGLVEMVREVNKGLNQIANLSMDTLLFRLLPVFEVIPDLLENEKDLETGLTPGKMFRRSLADVSGAPAVNPIQFNDISGGAVQVLSLLDRAHQEGSMVSEIQQSLPRYRGAQTAAESKILQGNQEGFFGNMAAEIEDRALKPLVELCLDTILQYLDTNNDPRIPSILGLGARSLSTLTKEELFEMVQGDYVVNVSGISSQIDKAQMLESLVQFMNIVGQNPEAWMPYVRQDTMLRRILEAFRPAIPDIEDLIETPEVAQAKAQAMQLDALGPDIVKALPGLVQGQEKIAAAQQQQAQQQLMLQQQFMSQQQESASKLVKTIAEIDKIYAEIEQMNKKEKKSEN